MKAIGLAALLTLPCFAAQAPAAPPDKQLQRAVMQLAALASDGYAQLHADRIEPVPSASPAGVAVVFVLEGPAKGNGGWQFLAFFEPNEALTPDAPPAARYRLVAFKKIGATGTRLFDSRTASFHDGVLAMSGSAFEPDDAMCCPSKPMRSVFEVRNDAIVERQVDR